MARPTAAEDGTIDLLTIHEARLMTVLDRNQSTPTVLATNLTWTWQMVARVANRLKAIGLVRTDHYTKAVYYRLTPDGESLLPLIRERTTKSGRFLTGAELNALAAEAERGYNISHLKRDRQFHTKATYHDA
jgi:DNA-binding MarR family transcriptional regulator